MMFKNKFREIIYFVLFTLITVEPVRSDNLIFIKEKNKLERTINSKKLGNYLRKMFMKKNNLINNDVIFLENNDFSSLKNEEDINFSNMINFDDNFEFKARLSALSWVRKNFENDNFKPYGVSMDKEMIEGWKNYLVLMIGNAGKHKLIKVCITTTIEDDFSIVTSYDKKCVRKITLLKKFNILNDMSLRNRKESKKIIQKRLKLTKRNKLVKSKKQVVINNKHSELKMNNSLSDQLKNYQKKLEELKKENEMKSKNLEMLKKQNEELVKLKASMQRKKQLQPKSFIEKNFEEASLIMKSQIGVITPKSQQKKFFSLDSLSHKFSVDELKKIKSLIKFAKINKILDTIYNKNGDVSVNELMNPNNVLLSFDKDSNYNIKNLMTSFFKNFTDNYHKEEDNVRYEISGFKKIEAEQQSKLQEYFGQMGENVNMIKNLMIFVKELSGEFQKSMLVFGNTLGSLSERVNNVSTKIDKLEGKFSNITEKVTNLSNHLVGNNTNKLTSQNELLKLIMENSTKTILNEYQTNLKKEVNFTLTTTLNFIKNISNNITSFIENRKNSSIFEIHQNLTGTNKEQNIKPEVKKELGKMKQKSLRKLKKTHKLKSVPQPEIIKKAAQVLTDDSAKDSLSEEDEFDSTGPKNTQKKNEHVKEKRENEEASESYLEP